METNQGQQEEKPIFIPVEDIAYILGVTAERVKFWCSTRRLTATEQVIGGVARLRVDLKVLLRYLHASRDKNTRDGRRKRLVEVLERLGYSPLPPDLANHPFMTMSGNRRLTPGDARGASVDEAADYLDIGASEIRHLCAQGKIKHTRPSGIQYAIPREELERVKQERTGGTREGYCRVKEAAGYMEVSQPTILLWCRKRQLKYIWVGRIRLISRDDMTRLKVERIASGLHRCRARRKLPKDPT
jgi:excisionase family DNA binding protein